MTARELTELLMAQTGVKREYTCDGFIAGDPNKTIRKVSTCFKATAEVLKKASAAGSDLLITHEPVFYRGDSREPGADIIEAEKWKLIDTLGLTVFRYHDYAHESIPDYIHAGFLKTVGLEINTDISYGRDALGISRYALKEPTNARALASRICEKLNLPAVRLVGNGESSVKVVCLGLGGVGVNQFMLLNSTDADIFITGEADEVCSLEYIRDTNSFGRNKSVLLLGHYGAEYAGMRLLADDISSRFLPALFIDGGEVFEFVNLYRT